MRIPVRRGIGGWTKTAKSVVKKQSASPFRRNGKPWWMVTRVKRHSSGETSNRQIFDRLLNLSSLFQAKKIYWVVARGHWSFQSLTNNLHTLESFLETSLMNTRSKMGPDILPWAPATLVAVYHCQLLCRQRASHLSSEMLMSWSRNEIAFLQMKCSNWRAIWRRWQH